MISRIQLRRILENLNFNKEEIANIKIKLERSLHLAITQNETSEEKSQDVVAYWKEKIEHSSDVVRLANEFLDCSTSIVFTDQKIIQWLVASTYSSGFKNGKMYQKPPAN